MTPAARERWLAELVRAGLEMKVLTEADILAHATPSVLASTLPRDLVVKVLDAALGTGTISPAAVLETVTPELLAHHVPNAIVWDCLATVAKKRGVPDGEKATDDGVREWLRHGLAVGLEVGIFSPNDVCKHANHRVLGTQLTDDLISALFEESLAIGRMTPELVIETVGLDQLTRHVSMSVHWAIFAEAARAFLAAAAAPVAAAPEPIKTESGGNGLATGSMPVSSQDDLLAITIIPDEPIDLKKADEKVEKKDKKAAKDEKKAAKDDAVDAGLTAKPVG